VDGVWQRPKILLNPPFPKEEVPRDEYANVEYFEFQQAPRNRRVRPGGVIRRSDHVAAKLPVRLAAWHLEEARSGGYTPSYTPQSERLSHGVRLEAVRAPLDKSPRRAL
jgi:hypothetical protein